MPATINGIGTHYYGAKNRSARVGTCKQCGRSATLSSYDTREWFCVLYIPLIPIKKYRILNDCSRCRKHYRITADEFAQKVAAATAPLRVAVRKTPSDPAPQIQLIEALIGWEMRVDAQKEVQDALVRFPQNVELISIAGQLAVDRNDFQTGLSLYERAYGIEPQNPGATYGYAWVLQHLERHEQAIPILQRAVGQDGNKLGALYLLGKSQMKLSRWNEALNSFQQLLTAEPAYTKDKQVLRFIADCKRNLGYELNPAERKARRRWWPFGGSAKRAPLQAQPALVRPSLRWAGLVIVGIIALGAGFYAWDVWTSVDVYFDNGLDRAVKVDLDGKHFDLALNSFHKESVGFGSHNVIVHEKDGKELERISVMLDRLNPVAALMHNRFFVYNVAARHIYRRGIHGYAQRAEDSSYRSELIGMQRFFEQRDVDFPFMPPPETVEMDANSSSVTKVSFDIARDLDLRKYALVRMQQGKMDEARTAIERAVKDAPCDTATRRTQIYFASVTGSFEAASQTAHRWIADCSQDDLEAHRAYQDINRENGREAALRDEYQKLLATSPQSAKAHYLFGRVASDPQVAIAEYQEAIRLDPKLVWPRVALGHDYQSLERYDDALRELSTALDMEGCDPSVVIEYANAAIARGTPGEAITKVDDIRKKHARDINALHARWLLALASEEWDRAAEIQKALMPLESQQTAWWRTTKVMRLRQDKSFDARVDAAMKSRDLQPVAIDFKIERLIENGDFAGAAELVARNAKDLDPTAAAMLDAYSAGGLLLMNQEASARNLLGDAEKMLAGAPKSSAQIVAKAIVEGLNGTMPLNAVMDVERDNDAVTHAWFVAAVHAAVSGDRKGARESFEHCVRTASDLDFPYLEAKAMEARLQ